MATIQALRIMFSAGQRSPNCRSARVCATISASKIRMSRISLPKLRTGVLIEELDYKIGKTNTQMDKDLSSTVNSDNGSSRSFRVDGPDDPAVLAKFYAIMEAVADRVEMHKGIQEQRDNWNHLFLNSINVMTLAAAIFAGLNGQAPLLALKLSSAILYSAVTCMLVVMNKIQPSQLAEEQRNAARLFKQLHGELQTVLALGNRTTADVNEAMEKVLALDRAYPLPLLGSMLKKFPSRIEPAVWWPQQRRKQRPVGKIINGNRNNSWDAKLEEEMRTVVDIIKHKDMADYLRLGEKALKLNKILAISGPLFTSLGAIASALVGTTHGSWPVIIGVVAGALASVVNTFEHGGQVGMVFEMYRGNAGFYKLMQETIEYNVNEMDVERRENGDFLEAKVALQLGRSVSELRNLAASASEHGEAIKEFASKLF